MDGVPLALSAKAICPKYRLLALNLIWAATEGLQQADSDEQMWGQDLWRSAYTPLPVSTPRIQSAPGALGHGGAGRQRSPQTLAIFTVALSTNIVSGSCTEGRPTHNVASSGAE